MCKKDCRFFEKNRNTTKNAFVKGVMLNTI